MKILITGAAGFIGFHLCKHLLEEGNVVVGIDNINNYYNPRLKYDRLNILGIDNPENWGEMVTSKKYHNRFRFVRFNIEDSASLDHVFEKENFEIVINLAAQAGVRYSIENPTTYIQSNIVGFFNILQACRKYPVKHLIFASSSSVYGNNSKVPFSEDDKVDSPISLYAATKKSNELMAYTYSYLYNMSITGLRFFTVYGPWGRPDMAYFKFSKAILEDNIIDVYNNGKLERDFTYIDDIIYGINKLIRFSSNTNYKIFNIGNNTPVKLMDFISILEQSLGKKAKLKFLPMQAGDVYKTFADIKQLETATGFHPKTKLIDGLSEFSRWFKQYYNF